MPRSSLLDAVPDAHRVTIMHEEDDVLFLETRQDVEPVIEAAKILADQPPGKDFRLAALIPEEVLNRSLLDGWFHDPKAWKAWANDPDNARFRVWPGRL